MAIIFLLWFVMIEELDSRVISADKQDYNLEKLSKV